MKLNMLHAAAIAMALAASSAQAHVIYESLPSEPEPNTCCAPYGSGNDDLYAIGDLITFGGWARNLYQATFTFFSDQVLDISNTGINLGLGIYTADFDPLSEGTSTVSLSSLAVGANSVSFTFATPLVVPDSIVYILSTDPDSGQEPLLNDLKLSLTTNLPAPGTDPIVGQGYGLTLNSGGVQINFKDVSGNPLAVGIVARFDAIPEPATLALMGLGLAGLGYIRRRKAVG